MHSYFDVVLFVLVMVCIHFVIRMHVRVYTRSCMLIYTLCNHFLNGFMNIKCVTVSVYIVSNFNNN